MRRWLRRNMLPSRMPELLALEKRVGLHYSPSRKCLIDSASFTLRPGADFVPLLSRPAKVWLAATVSPSTAFPVVPVIRSTLLPLISQRDEDGFTSCSACPCHRAAPTTPPKGT